MHAGGAETEEVACVPLPEASRPDLETGSNVVRRCPVVFVRHLHSYCWDSGTEFTTKSTMFGTMKL